MSLRLPMAFAAVVLATACGPAVDLTASLEVTTVGSGYYDNGLKDEKHHLLPSVAFQVKNTGEHDLSSLQVMIQFWKDGAPGEFDSRLISGVDLAAGAETGEQWVRAGQGYTLEDPDISALFVHSQFADFTVNFFARRSGQFVKIGESRLERRILPQVRDSSHP